MRLNGINYEIVKKTPTRKGYIRRKPDRTPTLEQLRSRYIFGKAAYDSFGEKETGEIPVAATAVKSAFVHTEDMRLEQILLTVIKKEEKLPPFESIEFDDGLEIIKYLTLLG